MSTAVAGSSLEAARAAASSTDYFALGYFALAWVSYTQEKNRAKALAAIPQVVPSLQDFATYPGSWTMLWGPAATTDNSNLMYAAAYLDKQSGEPIFAAVSIRGTDTSPGSGLGLLQEIGEDLEAGIQEKWPYGNPDGEARVARGTLFGLENRLIPLTDPVTGSPLVAFLVEYLAKHRGVPLIVTGHSLGGAQTTVMAMYLASVLPAGTIIVPNSFAAPTAGNQAFAALYEKTFAYCPRWYNDLDLVPMAFANLDDMGNLWTSCNMPPHFEEKAALDVFKALTHFSKYVQAGSPRKMRGTCMPQPPAGAKTDSEGFSYSWVGQLEYQHLGKGGYWAGVSAWPGVAQIAYPVMPVG